MRKLGNKKTVVKVSIDRKRLDIKRMTAELQREITDIFEDAAIEFVQVAAPLVPTLTGQAKAALINVAKSLGLDPEVSPYDPPLSENLHLYVALLAQGNTVERGKTMGHGELKTSRSPYFLKITLNITAAQNDFEYFTYWDQQTWHSLKEAVASVERHLKKSFKAPPVRFIDGRKL